MKACIVAVGSELLTPFRLDTNSLAITDRLNAIGIDVRMKAVAGDDVAELTGILDHALRQVDLVVCTGGLGPTADDITRDAVARLLDLPFDLDETIVAEISERFARRGLTMPDINRRQAMVPRGAAVLANPRGSAPGLWIERGAKAIVLLPGPPREMTPMLEALIQDRLTARAGGAGLYRRVLKITGRTESDVDAVAAPIYSRWTAQTTPIQTTILAVSGQIELHLTARAADRAAADPVLEDAVRQLVGALGDSVYSTDGLPLEAVVGRILRDRRMTLAVAESCSGGLVSSRLTDVPGSSEYLQGGMVCYSNDAKIEWLDVPRELIDQYGAVSEPVARAMAAGIRARARTQVGIGVTGIAGPGGGSELKPVGTVAVAVIADQAGDVREWVRTFQFAGGRELIKFQSATAGMNMLRLLLTR